ncbi:MAG: S16 family serine protease, partial [Psychrobacillus psychrotolerans]
LRRYAGKTIALIQLIGINLEVDYVHQMSMNVNAYQVKNAKKIGVTGAISKTGEVIEIGQVKEKVLSANKINLPYIILPLGNLEEGNEVVESLNLPIEVIGVQTVSDAIQKINELNEEK